MFQTSECKVCIEHLRFEVNRWIVFIRKTKRMEKMHLLPSAKGSMQFWEENWCKNPKTNFRSEQSSKNFCSALKKRRKVCKEEQIRLSDHNYCWFNEFCNTITSKNWVWESAIFIYAQKYKLTVKIFESRKAS